MRNFLIHLKRVLTLIQRSENSASEFEFIGQIRKRAAIDHCLKCAKYIGRNGGGDGSPLKGDIRPSVIIVI
jgi:hypothetical protein